MDTMEMRDLRERSLTTDDELHAGLELLLPSASERQVWLLFLDEDDRLMSPLMPLGDFPENPDDVVTSDDLGTVPHALAIVHRADAIRVMLGGERIVLVWEREGVRRLDESGRRWAAESTRHATEQDIPLRAQFLLHSRGMRQIHQDDL